MGSLIERKKKLMMMQSKKETPLWDIYKRQYASNLGGTGQPTHLIRANWSYLSTNCYYVPSSLNGYAFYQITNINIDETSLSFYTESSTKTGVAVPFVLKRNTEYQLFYNSSSNALVSIITFNADGSFKQYKNISSGAKCAADEYGRLLFVLCGDNKANNGNVEYTDIHLEEVTT